MQTHTTPAPTHSRWRLLSFRVLLSPACPAWLSRSLHQAIRADSAWSAAYDQHRQLERVASGAALSTGQVDLVERLLFAELAATAPATAPTPTRQRWLVPAGAFGVSGAFAVLALVVVGPVLRSSRATTDPSPAQSWTARGADDGPRVGVRARCIQGQQIVGDAEAGPRVADGRLRCPHGALLSLSLTNLEPTASFVYVVGVTAEGELRFVAPFDEVSSSIAVAPGTVDRPVDVVADTGVFGADDAITLFALFSPQPLRGGEIARTLRDFTRRGVRVQAIDRLPFDAFTARLELLP